MDFKKLFAVIGTVYCACLVACTSQAPSDHSDEHIIGNPTSAVSSLSVQNGNEPQNLVMFDKTVRRIHQFDLSTMQHIRSFEVHNPKDDHYVVYNQNGNYVVDLSLKGLSIFNKYNQANNQPIHFEGKPQSVAFDPSNGYLIVYDDLMSVGILKLDPNGEVLKSWVGGAVVSGNESISAGDVNSAGQLILALSDNSMVVVDIEQTLTQQKWVFTKFATTLTDIRWMAPLTQNPQQVLIRSADKIVLMDIGAQSILSSYDITDDVIKMSKFNDPHVILRSGSTFKVVYAASSTVQVKTLYLKSGGFDADSIMNSNLDLTRDTWSFVDTTKNISSIFNNLDETRADRRFKRYRFSDLLATNNKQIPSQTQVELSTGYIFTLFPSELGYAVRYDMNSDDQLEAKLFNLNYIPAN